jgi:hypothetical protein
LLFIFINNYILLPTFIASIIASYFQANLRDLSLISDADLRKYQACNSPEAVRFGVLYVCARVEGQRLNMLARCLSSLISSLAQHAIISSPEATV